MAVRQSWTIKKNIRVSTKTAVFFAIVQIWRTAILEPVGVQRHNVPHFKGIIKLYMDVKSSMTWHHFYYGSRPLEKSHFTP